MVERGWSFGKFPLRSLCWEMDVIVLARVLI